MLVAYEEAALSGRAAADMREASDPKEQEQDEGYNSHPGRRRRSSSGSSSIIASSSKHKLNDSEKHIQALERKLARVKNKRQQHRADSVGTSPLAAALPLDSPGNSDDEQPSDDEQADLSPSIVDDTETACLLYPSNASSTNRKQRRRRPSIEDVLEAERGRRRDSDSLNDKSYASHRDAEHTPTYTPSSNKITFSGQVRICGGIRSTHDSNSKSKSSERRASIYQTAPHLYGTSPSSSSYHSPTPPRRASLSRPSSFRSEVSRASTPASLYAPLLLPSKTAPSPSRTLYLTFAREQGRVLNSAYKDMVRKQQQKYEDRKKKARSKQGWLACLPSLFSYTGEAGKEEEEREGEDEEEERLRRRYKSEMQVLFGNRPWRYLKSSYWAYRIRGLCSPETGLDDDDLV